MNKDEALKIIKNEGLTHYAIGKPQTLRENELGIQKDKAGKWKVFVTDERASIVSGSEKIFESENDAWDNFIKRLRAGKRLEELEKK